MIKTSSIKTLSIVILALALAAPAAAASVEVRGVVFDETLTPYNNTIKWDAQNFEAFWYSFDGGKSSETLTIDQPSTSLTANSRTINLEKLLYNTSRTDQKYKVFSNKGIGVENGLDYDKSAKTFTKSSEGGYYVRLGWFGQKYVAVNGKANKITKLVKEQKTEDTQTMAIGDIWDLGEGYTLTASSISTKGTPGQVYLILSRNGIKLEDMVITEGEAYTYVQDDLAGESDVPVFVTYAESVFVGTDGNIVKLKYTWLISQDVTKIESGDEFGVFKVKEANANHVLLYNKDRKVNLNSNSVIDLTDKIKFKVADKSTALRFYPFVKYTTEAEPKSDPIATVDEKESPFDKPETSSGTDDKTGTPPSVPTDTTTTAVTTSTAATSAPLSAQTSTPEKVQSLVPAEATKDYPVQKQPGFGILSTITVFVLVAYAGTRIRG